MDSKNFPFFHDANPELFERAKQLRKSTTPPEDLLWSNLRRKKLEGKKFRRQHPIDNYVVDFYCHEARLVIEVDGIIHLKDDQPLYDKDRQEKLETLGLKVIRFTNKQVENDITVVLQEIKKHL